MFAFLLIGGIGFFLLVITWFMGELFDLGHEVADFFGDHLGSLEVDGHHVELGHGTDAGEAGPSPFSSRIIFAFMTAFGGGGAIATIYGLSVPVSALIGVAAGVVIGGATWVVARILWQQQGSSGFEMASLVGQTGRVAVAIPAGGTGQVTVSAGGGSSTLLARARGGAAVAPGSLVRIVGIEGDLLLVDRTPEPV